MRIPLVQFAGVFYRILTSQSVLTCSNTYYSGSLKNQFHFFKTHITGRNFSFFIPDFIANNDIHNRQEETALKSERINL